jgi:hypothetical protein
MIFNALEYKLDTSLNISIKSIVRFLFAVYIVSWVEIVPFLERHIVGKK